MYMIVAMICIYIHSVFLYFYMVVYNVLFNADLNTFLIMVFVNSSMKLKSTVYKKFNESAYFN